MSKEISVGQKLYHFAYGPLTVVHVSHDPTADYVETVADFPIGYRGGKGSGQPKQVWRMETIGHWLFENENEVGNENNDFPYAKCWPNDPHEPIFPVADAKDKVYLFPWQNMGNDCLDLQIFNWKTKEIKNAGLINSDDENQRERIVADEIVFVSKNKDACVRFVTGKDLQWHEYYVDSGEHRSFKIKADFSNEQNMRVLIDYYKKFKAEGHPLSEQQIVLKKYIEEIVC